MKLASKVLIIAVLLAGLFALTFVWWGEAMEKSFSGEAFVATMGGAKQVGWLMGLALLVVDLVLPVPATGVMSALGTMYGFWLGWLVGAAGSTLAATAGYGLVRLGGGRIAHRLASPKELDEFRCLFDRWGPLAIIASRAMPILPEVMAVLAGLARMRLRTFLPAVLAGTVPVAGLFAWWGSHAGAEAPGTSFLVAVGAPLILWALALPVLRRAGGQPDDATPSRAVAEHDSNGANSDANV